MKIKQAGKFFETLTSDVRHDVFRFLVRDEGLNQYCLNLWRESKSTQPNALDIYNKERPNLGIGGITPQ